MGVLLGKRAKEFVSEYTKVNPAGIDIAPKAIFRIPEEKIECAYFDGKKRGYIVNKEFVPIKEVLERIDPENSFWVLERGCIMLSFRRSKSRKST